MEGPSSRSFVSQRLRLHYMDWGNPDAPPLVLVHGGLDHCRNWDWVAQELCRDWHVIAPDLRGHGDSEWTSDGHYPMAGFVADLAQLIHQQVEGPVNLIGHSLGGNICLRYAGLYPDSVRRLVAIEGLGPSPAILAERAAKGTATRLRDWIAQKRALAARQPRHYATLEEAVARMRAQNTHLSAEQAAHLTWHGVNRNEDGSYGWKFDNYVRARPPEDMPQADLHALWAAITCPVLLVCGQESWATDPNEDGRAAYFRNARVSSYARAGHWVHHDRLADFLVETASFLD